MINTIRKDGNFFVQVGGSDKEVMAELYAIINAVLRTAANMQNGQFDAKNLDAWGEILEAAITDKKSPIWSNLMEEIGNSIAKE